MPDPSIRPHIGQQIMKICTGHPTEDTLSAQADALATAVGGIAFLSHMTLAEAQASLARIHEAMQQHVAENWGQIARGDH